VRHDPATRRLDCCQYLSIATTPLLVFDIWEHAYYLQYKNVKADYVKQLWNVVNWDEVSRRFADARAGHNGLRLPTG
jgi:superoxide dismutase, Fe-Mn family